MGAVAFCNRGLARLPRQHDRPLPSQLRLAIMNCEARPGFAAFLGPAFAIRDGRLSSSLQPDMTWRPLLRGTRFLTVLACLGLASAGTPARAATFANPGQIGIPLVGPANPYPSTITVSNLSGEIVSVTVT